MDAMQFRFEPPYPEVPIVDKAVVDKLYDLVVNISSFQILRKSDNTVM